MLSATANKSLAFLNTRLCILPSKTHLAPSVSIRTITNHYSKTNSRDRLRHVKKLSLLLMTIASLPLSRITSKCLTSSQSLRKVHLPLPRLNKASKSRRKSALSQLLPLARKQPKVRLNILKDALLLRKQRSN